MHSPVNFSDGSAHVDGASLTDLATLYGTPLYVYSEATLLDRCRRFRKAFADTPTAFFFAVKANLNPTLLKRIFTHGFGADVVSGGELAICLAQSLPANQIVFSGVGKTDAELSLAIRENIHAIQVESPFELERIASLAQLPQKVRLSLRINLDIDAHTHPHITTATKANKFGMAETELPALLANPAFQKNLQLVGLSCHLGSQIHETAPFEQAATRLVTLAKALVLQGFPIECISLGGGLGIAYTEKDQPISVEDYAAAILKPFKGSPFRLNLEPGRWIIAESGILLTQVLGVKASDSHQFVVVDAGMNDLIRPALYAATHPFGSVTASTRTMTASVVGPVCETADTFLTDASIPEVHAGDLVYFGNAGAYGMSMASTYNGRPRSAELLVTANQTIVIRPRETIEDLIPR